MSRQTADELRRLSSLLERQGERVLHQTTLACRSLTDPGSDVPDPQSLEDAIDREEVVLEEEALRIMALHHPIGGDLRALVTVLRANGDLERIADHALSVLEASPTLSGPVSDALSLLSARILGMLARALSALRERDPRIAQTVLDESASMRSLSEAAWRHARIRAGSGMAADLDNSFLEVRIGQDLRRIGDLACNIAEDVLYQEDGKIVRHGGVGG
jgi:phosphate transport system protein